MVLRKYVNCRIGSLEIPMKKTANLYLVNCRIGSLESQKDKGWQVILVNCRIGSLEKSKRPRLAKEIVNCRIGSLERKSRKNGKPWQVNCRIGSLEIEMILQKFILRLKFSHPLLHRVPHSQPGRCGLFLCGNRVSHPVSRPGRR